MADVEKDGIWELADLLSAKPQAQQKRSVATVTRVDSEGTVWVHLPGGVEETPVNGLTTSEVQAGDVVQVQIENGRANLIGNATSPSVGQERVDKAIEPVKQTAEKAAAEVGEAKSTADAARAIAEATGQHFWYDDSGAHISTEALNPEGAQNSLWNSLGMLFRRGANNLLALVTGDSPGVVVYDGEGNDPTNIAARFTSSGAVVGRDGARRIELEDGSFTGYDTAGAVYVEIAQTGAEVERNYRHSLGRIESGKCPALDGRTLININALDLSAAVSGTDIAVTRGVTLLISFESNIASLDKGSFASGTILPANPKALMLRPLQSGQWTFVAGVDGSYSYTASATLADGTSGTIQFLLSYTGGIVSSEVYLDGFVSADSWGFLGISALVSATVSSCAPTYVFGEGDATGSFAVSEGSGAASGDYSRAQNLGTTAASDNQTALGKYNIEDANDEYAIVLGNGTADDARSNALTVSWDGHIELPSIEIPNNDTGILLTAQNISDSSTTPTETSYSRIFGLADNAEVLRSYLAHVDATNGQQGVQLETRRVVNGGNVYNGVQLRIDASGNRTVSLSDADAWLTALGLLEDWKTLSWASGFKSYNDSEANGVRYKRIGNVVYVRGIATPTAQIASGKITTMCTLPTGYRPTGIDRGIGRMQGSGMNSWDLHVKTSGQVTIERYGTTTNSAIATGAWLPFDFSFAI